MPQSELSGCKKRKRGERVFRFKIFGENGYPVEFEGSFKQNIKALLEYGHFDSNTGNGIPSWSFQLEVNRQPPLHIWLFVVEEPIEASLQLHCKHCQYIGWGHHMICNKKYHFVLPSKDTVSSLLNCEGEFNGEISCKDTLNLVQLQGHVMHGVFHSNGFGHLLCINGMEAGSNLAGRQIMEFWDRLCTGLRARKVSLNDDSQKRSMELRLLFGVAYGEPWFGRWGYRFGRGCFGVTQPMYQKAVETIQGMPLCILVHYLGTSNPHIPAIFSRYQILSDRSLVTLGELFRFMLEIKTRLPEGTGCSSDSGKAFETTCRWSPKRIEMATRVIVEALKRAEFRWVSRQEVRDAARAYIGDTGLLDFVLKSLGNHVVGNYLVRRCLNPVTKVLEYCLEDVSNLFPDQNGGGAMMMGNSKVKPRSYKMTRPQLMKDMLNLYRYVLKDQQPAINMGILAALPAAVRIILDCKYLVKECNGDLPWRGVGVGNEPEPKLKLCCTVTLRSSNTTSIDAAVTHSRHGQHGGMINMNKTTSQQLLPFECITLKNDATIDDLKLQAEKNFRELYWGLRSFVVESIANLQDHANGKDTVAGVLEVGRVIVLEGSIDQENGSLSSKEGIYERDPDDRIIDCPCGTKDDDGQRMLSCDICEVWQHTRCVRIPNSQQIPPIFLCNRCENEIIILPSLP
ncbi:hypothetical protein Tsubulata_032899 [Turnera subulata]|uniref:Zinc finger PHD-type domain-containing protein n=1 Tax=Turnera subulata TaxID=218843 RepID=A0A9Q0FCR3_9ROSI|nr:hypothetical protein Tsubulata_032899 [Turnera subulata]